MIIALESLAPRTVYAPYFTSAPMRFRIGAVHLSDTATKIDVDIYQLPNYWVMTDTNVYLESQITENIYKVKRIEGLPLREKIFVGDSAHIHATYVFDPLAPVDSVFDFIERGGYWVVKGIDLNYEPEGFKTHISGTVKDRPTASWLLLLPAGDDLRTKKSIVVPVNDGKFEYDLYTTDTLAYSLIVGMEPLQGSWKEYKFFSEGQPITVEIDNSDRKPWETVKGGPMTYKFSDLMNRSQQIVDESRINEQSRMLDSLKRYYVPRVYEIRSQMEEKDISQPRRDSLSQELIALQKSGQNLSPEGIIMNVKMDSIWQLVKDLEFKFIETDASPAGLFLIYEKSLYKDTDFEKELEIFKNVYLHRYADHPYSLALKQHISNEGCEVGKRFPNFSAPDLDGNMQTLSDLIEGKYAVIDLWASWCGPCRRHSIELIPVYEKWKEKGFTVVGVAREHGDTKAMENSIKHDGYPWINLVELNDAHNIWNLYRAGNSGGRIVMVHPSGVVIAVDPDAAEVEDLLTKFIPE